MADILSALNQTASIDRAQQTEQSNGSTTTAWRRVYPNTPCRIVPRSGAEGVRYGRETSRVQYQGIFRPEVVIDARDRVAYGTKTLEVLAVWTEYDDMTGLAAYVNAELEETV